MECVLIVLLTTLSLAYGTKCYNCSSSGDDDCRKGLSTIPVVNCDSEDNCLYFQHDLYESGEDMVTGTTRGCINSEHKLEKVYCATLESYINKVLYPAVIKLKQCYICDEDLCNTSSNISLSSLVVITVFLTYLILSK